MRWGARPFRGFASTPALGRDGDRLSRLEGRAGVGVHGQARRGDDRTGGGHLGRGPRVSLTAIPKPGEEQVMVSSLCVSATFSIFLGPLNVP